MRAAQIKDGVVVNFALVGGFDGIEFVDPEGVDIGYIWDGVRFVPPPIPQPTKAEYLTAVDDMLAEGAARKQYDSIHSAALRAGYAGPFHDEGVAYATWMDSVYSTCYSIMAQVEAGKQPPPATTGALLALLPQCPFAAGATGG